MTTVTVEQGARALLLLAEKPREELTFSQNMQVLVVLEKLGYAAYHKVSNMSDQNIWMITHSGIRWLIAHGLL